MNKILHIQPSRATLNKRAGVRHENRIAVKLGTKRYLANTGGPVDLVPVDGMVIQVKGGATVVTQIMRNALASARAGAAARSGSLPAVALVDTRGARSQDWICFPLDEWCAWNGYPREVQEAA